MIPIKKYYFRGPHGFWMAVYLARGKWEVWEYMDFIWKLRYKMVQGSAAKSVAYQSSQKPRKQPWPEEMR